MPKIQLSLSLLKKHDSKDAIAPAEITDAVSLYSINDHEWHLQAHSAL
jgi:ADP-ribosylation factor-like protein 5B